jgi:diaminobutyrate acetyltransferase
MSLEAARKQAPVLFRPARAEDGQAMWALVKEMGGLELNTAYFYILYCLDYADSCVVAEVDGRLAGFVLGHRPPKRQDSVFVWQVGVAPWMRKQGLAGRLLDALLEQQPASVRWLEATVTPDNTASRSLFRALARRRGVDCQVSDFMSADLFPGVGHEPEELFRIGPLVADNDQTNSI